MLSRKSMKYRPQFETLESRALLSASAGLKAVAAHAAHTPVVVNRVASALVSSLKSDAHSVTNLSATLTNATGGTAAITFHSNTEHGKTNSEFNVQVQGAAANATLPVSINGTVVGQVHTDASGNGSLMFKTNPHGPNQQAFPANFPTSLAAGATVSVGTDLSGTLNTGGGDHDDHENSKSETHLTASLTGTGTATGTIDFISDVEHGAANFQFTANVKGATPNSMVPVSINGTVVGQIQTDASGNGSLVFSSNPTGTQLPFPANFPFPTSLAAGLPVSIGSLTGVLGTAATKVNAETAVSASLTGTTAATGSALYVNDNVHGLNVSLFTVNVKGAAANTSLDVTVAGTKVGTIKTDASGNGTLVFSSVPAGSPLAFPANFPANVGAGTSISVGTILNGTLA